MMDSVFAFTDLPIRLLIRGGGLLADNMGYLVGAGAVFLIAGIAALWSYLG
jgi:hypothetical protein